LHAARYRLAALGLPRSDSDAQEEIDRSPRFGASSLQEQQRIQHTLEMDLARSIQTLEAVELARVHLALPKVSPFLRDAPPATAAVLVRLRPGARLSTEQVSSIQTLVAASVPRLKRAEVQVFDPRGVLLGGAPAELVQSQRLALEQDLVRRALAVLVPWLGKDRVSVQVTATLADSETRQTVERVRNVVVGGQARPLEKTVRTTSVPEGRIQKLHAIVILGYDASAEDRKRVEKLASQALGLEPARGDSMQVYALPATAETPPQAQAAAPAAPKSIPRVQPQRSVVDTQADALPAWPPASWAALAGGVLLLGGAVWWRMRRQPQAEAPQEDFDAELEAARNQTLADPRVTADVIKLWMRA
jgi:flagellar M-ring protein FliF